MQAGKKIRDTPTWAADLTQLKLHYRLTRGITDRKREPLISWGAESPLLSFVEWPLDRIMRRGIAQSIIITLRAMK